MSLFGSKEKKDASSITGKESRSFDIIFAGLVLLVVSVMVVTAVSYKNNKSAIEDLSEEVIFEINQLVFQESKNYLMTAVDMTELSSKITGENVDSLEKNTGLDSLMINILKLHPQLTNFEIGNEEGDFLMQKREKDGSISTKNITRTKGKDEVIVKWRRRDIEGKVIKEETDPNDTYDPRVRPWYIGAKEAGKLFWSDLYIFATDKVPGVTASSPVFSNKGDLIGVFGLDIPLNTISEFLAKMKEDLQKKSVGRNSVIFIVNSKNEIVAFPDPKIPMIDLGEGKFRPRKVEELENFPQIVTSYKYHIENNFIEKFNIEIDGVKYITSYKPFNKENFDKDWTIGLIVPEDDLIGAIKKTNNLLIAVSIGILIAAIILGAILRKIKKALDLKSRFIKETFGKYLSDEIVNNILETPGGMQLGGDKRIVTIMMTDLRGFTSLGERLPAESVVNMINIYLDCMTDVILKYNGTIDEFIGDAILVIFGAPMQREDDAQRAVACAIDMQKAMVEVNRRNKEAGYPEVQMGIGLNTGDIVVGNIGSSKRMKYGVVGKNVNLTSRVESYTVGGQILVSPSTVEACKGLLRIDDQFEVMPKGVNNPIIISEIGGIAGEFNTFLAEKKAIPLKIVKSNAQFQFTVLAGKHASNDVHLGKILEIAMEEAILEAPVEVEKLNNIKITGAIIDGKTFSTDLYGKVIKNISSKPIQFRINFTSTPPDSGKVLQDIITNHTF
jgi:class 3 adenylate cyclase